MSVIYILGGIQVFGVQTTWNRIPIRTNSDGTMVYSPWLSHTWKVNEMEIATWNALQSIEGGVISSIQSNHIENGNEQNVYNEPIFVSLKGTARGHLMINVEINLSVAEIVPLNWWQLPGLTAIPIAAYQPIGAADLATSYINLVNPGVNDASPIVAPTLVTDGWLFDTTQSLDTGLPLLNDYSVFVSTHIPLLEGGGDGSIFGVVDLLDFYIRGTRGSSSTNYFFTYDILFYNDGAGGRDHVTAIFNGGGIVKPLITTVIGASNSQSSAVNTLSAYIGARNNAGVAEDNLGGTIKAMVVYQGAITNQQANDISANMAVL